jgi:hypothetical protein
MTERISKEVVEKLMHAPSACQEAVQAGERYLKAVGTPEEEAARQALVEELKEDVTDIDGLIAFASSPAGEAVFGKEGAEATRKAAEAAKAGGEHYCICDACQAGAEILREAGEV